MLVVDRTVFNQLQADQSGVDLLELGASLIRHQNAPFQTTGSTPSILDSDTTSKGISPTSLGYGPPAYEDIFGLKDLDLPPSYSEVSLMLKGVRGECIELEEIRVDRARTISDSVANNDECSNEEGQENQTDNIENS